jgi:hypothetical protein
MSSSLILAFQLDIRIVTISLHLHLEKQCFVYLEIIFFNSIIIYGQRILLNLVLGAVWNFLWGMCTRISQWLQDNNKSVVPLLSFTPCYIVRNGPTFPECHYYNGYK